MANSKCIIAAAGSGKTTYVVNKALGIDRNSRVLIATYTRENEKEIRKKIVKRSKAIPGNVTVQTWWSFLFRHGVRPYQNLITEKPINGLMLTEKQSGLRYESRDFPVYWGKNDIEPYYFTESRQIYSDKIAIFVIRCNEITDGAVFDRLSKIFDYVFIDEVQDLAGYDLDIVCNIIKTIPTVLVGDPRQVTYHTHHSTRNRKYANGLIDQFIVEKCNEFCDIDYSTLRDSFRCNREICNYSNSLFPDFPVVGSLSESRTGHDGIFFISPREVEKYLKRYEPVQLRYSQRTRINEEYPVYNFGESKGLTFDRVVIYPTNSIKDYINKKTELPSSTLCRYYVALTRARYSVAIVWNNPPKVEGIATYSL